MQVQYNGHRYDDDDARLRFLAQALEAVRHVPGVAAAAFTSLLPLSGDRYGVYGTQFEDGNGYDAFRYAVTPGYCEAMGIALRRGRLLDAHDTAGAPLAVLISESLAKRQFPGQDPVGRRVHVGPHERTVVHHRWRGGRREADFPGREPTGCGIHDACPVMVRGRRDVAGGPRTGRRGSAGARHQQAIWSVDKDQPIVRVATMDTLLAKSESQRRFAMIVFEAFALVALVLAATGIYGVLSGSVTERMREIGVRSALGASRADILALVVRQGMTLTGLGVAIGLVAAAAASRALVTLLFGVSRLDPVTYLGVIALAAGVSAIACWVPAWRAARVDPSITLRAE